MTCLWDTHSGVSGMKHASRTQTGNSPVQRVRHWTIYCETYEPLNQHETAGVYREKRKINITAASEEETKQQQTNQRRYRIAKNISKYFVFIVKSRTNL